MRGRSVPVVPVLFLWGPTKDGETRPTRAVVVDGVAVVHGIQAGRRWLADLNRAHPAVSVDDVAALHRAAVDHLFTRERHDARRTGHNLSLQSLYWTAVACTAAGCAALELGLQVISYAPWQLSAAVLTAMAAIGLGSRQVARLRYPADAWLTCTAALAALLAVAPVTG